MVTIENSVKGGPSSLLTDLYQLTMGYGYWKSNTHERRSVFHLFFRRPPFAGGYAVAAGLEPALNWLSNFAISASQRDYLQSLTGNDGQALFEDDFLDFVANTPLQINVDAVAEGTVVFPHEPLLRISGPLWQCQWVETALLTLVNFQTLIATKAARVCDAAKGDQVLEFGLRRAQGFDGGLSASRAAYIGGCDATSNVAAGMKYGIPVRGTHAHSWVMSFQDETSSFVAYADAMPNNCVFLVDTYDTLQGVGRAIEVGRKLRGEGHKMVGVRLDSGDLAKLSREARRMLDDAGFQDAAIVASNDLDEFKIAALKAERAKISVWGVGTNLVTAADQPALGGVYKLAAIEDDQGQMQPRIKLSQDAIKTSNPGVQQVRRYLRDGKLDHDVLFDESLGLGEERVSQSGQPRETTSMDESTDLLQPAMRSGERVGGKTTLDDIRRHALRQRGMIPDEIRALQPRAEFPMLLDKQLWQRKQTLIEEAGGTP